jgi:proteasome lid subunit RPN8/RPN11
MLLWKIYVRKGEGMDFYISQKDWKKVIDYAQASYDQFKSEVGGFMIAMPDKDGNIIISEPEILKQEVTGGTTEMDKDAVADYYVKCAEKHGAGVRFVWWHSHANMDAFWSTTDTDTMKEYSSGDWSAFLVVNIRQAYKFRVSVWNPIKAHEDIELKILDAKPKKLPKGVVDAVSKLCSKPELTANGITHWNGSYNRSWANPQQTSLYGGSSLDFTKKTGDDIDIDEPLLSATVDVVDEFNSLYTEGEFTFKDWLNSIKSWNAILENKKQSFNIVELTENELHEKCGYYTGYDTLDFLNLGEKDEKNIKV